MSLFGFFKPKWQHKNPAVRLEAISSIDHTATEILLSIVKDDSSPEVKEAAVQKIDDLDILQTLVSDKSLTRQISSAIVSRICSLYQEADEESDILNYKLEKLSHIKDQHILAEIMYRSQIATIQEHAGQQITDENLLVELALKDCSKQTARIAVASIIKENNLKLVEKKATCAYSRDAAAQKLSTLKENCPAPPKKSYDTEMITLQGEAKALLDKADPELAYANFKELEKKWPEQCEKDSGKLHETFIGYGDVLKDRLERFLAHQESSRNKLKEQAEKLEGLKHLASKIELLQADPSDANTQQVLSISKEWKQLSSEIATVPEEHRTTFQLALESFDRTREKYIEEQTSLQNMKDIFRDIEAKKYASDPHRESKMFKQINTVLQKKGGFQYLAVDSFVAEFNAAYKVHLETRKEIKEKNLRDNEKHIQQREEFLQEIDGLIKAVDTPESMRRLREIESIWTKQLPACSELNKLDARFREAVKKFNKTNEEYIQQRDWQYWSNQNIKEKLIAQMNSLEGVNDLHRVFKEMKSLQQQWKQVGHVSPKVANKLWKKFKKSSDKNFQRCQKFFREQDEIAEQNYHKKLLLLEKAKKKNDSVQWNRDADYFKTLQAEWKKIGRAPKEKEAKIFQEFRQTCDQFFMRRKEHYQQMEERRTENLTKKEEICQELENIVKAPNIKLHERFLELEDTWKRLGAVPKDKEEIIQQRFKTCCDHFYEWFEVYKNRNTHQERDNLKKKEELCQRLETIGGVSNAKKMFATKNGVSLTLSEQLEIALQSEEPPKHKQDLADVEKEIQKIEDEWNKHNGGVAQRHEQYINDRYQNALKACHAIRNGTV